MKCSIALFATFVAAVSPFFAFAAVDDGESLAMDKVSPAREAGLGLSFGVQ